SADIPLRSSHRASGVRTNRTSTLSQLGQRPTNPGSGPYTWNVATWEVEPHPRHRPTAVVTSTANTSDSGPASVFPSYAACVWVSIYRHHLLLMDRRVRTAQYGSWSGRPPRRPTNVHPCR